MTRKRNLIPLRPRPSLPTTPLPTEEEIVRFAESVPIATRDFGVATIRTWGTQRTLTRAILRGVAEGARQFVVLKCRQAGVTTWMLLLTIFWMKRFPGLQGLTVPDSEENSTYFRDLFMEMVRSATDVTVGEEAIPGFRTKNRFVMTWENQSRLMMQTAGQRTWRRLGVGRGLSFHHGTEVALWGSGQGVTFLRSAFSELHPGALYVFEGTARGKNWFMDLWEDAGDAATMRQVFLSWWLRDDYTVSRTDVRWKKYWTGMLTPRERAWDQQLRADYRVVLTPSRWGWRRWYVAEKAGGSERLADQEMPTVPEDAFGASQERPFLESVSRTRVHEGIASAPVPTKYRYAWSALLEDTKAVVDHESPMLRVWVPPDDRPVVIGAVPAYSSFENDGNWVVSVWAASVEKEQLEQVAEFASDEMIGVQPFSWIVLHLAGAYGATYKTMILEIAGLGSAVLAEIKRLVNTGWGTSRRPEFKDFLGSIRHYVWRRPDAMFALGALQFKSSPEIQGGILQRLRDQVSRGYTLVRSAALADELDRLEAAGDTFKAGGREPRAHRAMAAALAIESYASQLFPYLKRARAFAGSSTSVGGRAVQSFMEQLKAPQALVVRR